MGLGSDDSKNTKTCWVESPTNVTRVKKINKGMWPQYLQTFRFQHFGTTYSSKCRRPPHFLQGRPLFQRLPLKLQYLAGKHNFVTNELINFCWIHLLWDKLICFVYLIDRNVLDKDILSKSDPMCVCLHQPLGSGRWVELMRTETIQNNLSPNFFKKVGKLRFFL